jgi:hypothetical protein
MPRHAAPASAQDRLDLGSTSSWSSLETIDTNSDAINCADASASEDAEGWAYVELSPRAGGSEGSRGDEDDKSLVKVSPGMATELQASVLPLTAAGAEI